MLRKVLPKHRGPTYFVQNLLVVLGIVLIWRGMWYALDEFDILIFGGNHFISAIGGVVLGVLILYLPDRDLKELTHL